MPSSKASNSASKAFDRELAELTGDFVEPKGRFPLARTGAAVADAGAVELKRLYLRPADGGAGR